MRMCPSCGYHNLDGAVYCAFCRQHLPEAGDASGVPVTESEPDAAPVDMAGRPVMGRLGAGLGDLHLPPPLTVLMTLLIAAILIVGVVLGDQIVGPARVQRDQRLQLMQKELGLLPPFRDSRQTQVRKTNLPFHSAQLEVDYSTSSTCSDVMDYYWALEQRLGWYVLAPQIAYPAGGPKAEEYGRFTAQGTTIYVNVQCAISLTEAGSYTLTMRTDTWAVPSD
jgi:hypothetical protein